MGFHGRTIVLGNFRITRILGDGRRATTLLARSDNQLLVWDTSA